MVQKRVAFPSKRLVTGGLRNVTAYGTNVIKFVTRYDWHYDWRYDWHYDY